jgi:ABC-type nitrate/sulfonate/bicarbonate transport system ATPase subunit
MLNLEINVERKAYAASDQAVLGNIRASIGAGQFVALVGPSGTGKTTLLNMVAGLESSDPGNIRIDGVEASGIETNRKIGYIFQQPRLMSWMTVMDNLRLTSPDASTQDIQQMLHKVGLEGKGGEYPRTLSGGMQKRVSIARAFLNQPELLLLDEPFVSLDQPTAEHLRSMLEHLWLAHRPTVIFVTHDLDEAIQLADRVLFLSKAPGSLMLDQDIEIARPRLPESVSAWKQRLLASQAGLLQGVLEAD